MTRADDLERLLDEAREASPAERLPTYRDAIAAFGEEAIEPLATWLEEPAFAAFAIRTLGRIAVTHPEARAAVVAVMATTDRLTMPDHIARDLEVLVLLGDNVPRIPATHVGAGPDGADIFRPLIVVSIELAASRVRVPALVDSGADNTLVAFEWIRPLGVDFATLPPGPGGSGPGGSLDVRPCKGIMRWDAGNASLMTEFLVAEHSRIVASPSSTSPRYLPISFTSRSRPEDP